MAASFKLSGMKFRSNSITYSLSIVLLVVFIIYSLTALGVAGTIFSSALGLIAYGMMEKMEIAIAVTIISGILLKVLFPTFKRLSDGFTVRRKEGFEDVPVAEPENKEKEDKENAEEVVESDTKVLKPIPPAPVQAAEDEKKDKDVALAEAKEVAGFTDKASAAGLFKLGELPSEAKDGNYIDVGTTIMRSLSALKPDQISQMTADTRSLLETQKSLMTMLNSMKPMLVDGQQLLSSFSGMFGGK
jgi:hypothetical protein